MQTPAGSDSIGLRISSSQIAACSFERWYPRFRLSGNDKHTFKSRFIPLEKEFVEFLMKDGIVLPRAPNGSAALRGRDPRKLKSKQIKEEEEDGWDEDEEDANDFCFDSLESRIETMIEQLDGELFPKLNWTSPRDAEWAIGGSLACGSPGEIFLVLKASSFCQYDIQLATETSCPVILVLRKFVEVNRALEFRCFVRNGKLAFACQRDPSKYYEYLNEPAMKEKLLNLLRDFVAKIIVPRFDTGGGSGFIADVYVEITGRRPKGKCWLVDVSPLPAKVADLSGTEKAKSDAIENVPPHPLLTWDEVLEDSKLIDDPRLIVVTSRHATDCSEQTVLSMHKVPLDLVKGDLSSSTIDETFQRFKAGQLE